MTLTTIQKGNLKVLLGIATNTYYDDITISDDKCSLMSNTFMLSFIRKVTIEQLKAINIYLDADIRTKELVYGLIVNKESNTIKLSLNDVYIKDSNSSFNDVEDKIKRYNDKITDKLSQLSNYLFETLYPTDTRTYEWAFYYISKFGDNIGFANKDYQNIHSTKIFNNQNLTNPYENVLKFIGTLNDAEIRCLRRNINSKFESNWQICPYGMPINQLYDFNISRFN